MKVNINELEKITLLLYSKIKEYEGNELELDYDFYWDISSEKTYDSYEEPKVVMLGQLSCDLEEIQRLNTNADEVVSYDIKRLGTILRALSFQLQNSSTEW